MNKKECQLYLNGFEDLYLKAQDLICEKNKTIRNLLEQGKQKLLNSNENHSEMNLDDELEMLCLIQGMTLGMSRVVRFALTTTHDLDDLESYVTEDPFRAGQLEAFTNVYTYIEKSNKADMNEQELTIFHGACELLSVLSMYLQESHPDGINKMKFSEEAKGNELYRYKILLRSEDGVCLQYMKDGNCDIILDSFYGNKLYINDYAEFLKLQHEYKYILNQPILGGGNVYGKQ